MKRSCPFCGARLKGRDFDSHIFEVHQGKGQSFFCRDGCVRCCTDEGAPLELVLSDIERISMELGISAEDFFRAYGGVLWTNIPGTSALVPSTGLPFPCAFLKEGRCRIYGVRPLHCRLFPERLYIDPSPHDLKPFSGSGYVCVDDGIYLDDARRVEVTGQMDIDRRELERTADFFRNEEHIYELTPAQERKVQVLIAAIDTKDPERNRKKREIIEGMIPEDFKASVEEAFLLRLRELDMETK